MPRLSHFLTSALNQSAITPDKVDHLIERWELALCDIGSRRGWYDAMDTVYLSHRGGVAHTDDVITCDCCSGSELDYYAHEVRGRNHYGRTIESLYCEACRNNETFYCENCHTTWQSDCAEQVGDEYYCVECAPEMEEEQIPSYHSAHRPKCPFDKALDRIYSVELELESPDRARFAQLLRDKALERVIWESDGSLCSEKGIEVIICYQRDIYALENILSEIALMARKTNAKSWSAGNCGVHINSNRCKLWTQSAVMRLLWLVKRHGRTLKAIAGRESHYASWDHLPSIKDWARGFCEKYTCVRVGADRLEWRMFRGTLNSARLGAYIQTVKVLEDYALNFGIAQLAKSFAGVELSLRGIAEHANENGAKIRL